MKRYCLTECFRKKISTTSKMFITLITTILVILIILTGIYALSYAVGFGMEFLIGPVGGLVPADLGIIIIFTTLFSIGILYVLSIILYGIIKAVSRFIINRYERRPIKCNVIEECKTKDEQNE